jgi:hypothetical protein
MLHSRLVHAAVGAALLAAPLLLFSHRALAIQDSEDKVAFGPLAVGEGQGARVNVYGIGNPNEAPWEFTVRIFNREGAVAQSRQFMAAPGVIRSFEISVQDQENFPVDRLGRRTLRAEIVGFNPQPDLPGKYAATLEVYSLRSGHTSILVGNPDILPPLSGIVAPPQ